MRVLHINRNYFGHNSVHRNMIQEMNRIKGINNYVFAAVGEDVNGNQSDKIVASKCLNRIDRLFFFHKSKKIRNRLNNTFNIEDFDIVHAYTLFTDGYVAYRINKKYHIPYVVAIRDTDINSFLKYKKYLKPLARKILNNTKYIFFLSDSYKLLLTKLLYNKENYPFESKTVIVPNGIDNFWLENINDKKENLKKEVNVIYVGTICKRKNITTTLQALNLLRNKGYSINYTAVGPIQDKVVYNSIINEKNACYIEKKSKEELIKIYRENDIFVMPSHNETFGIVYAEAMSQGLPVIYTKNQGFDNQFEDGEVGFHVDDKDYIDVANKIEMVIKDYERISRNCIKNVQKFNWKTIVEKYVELYKKK